MKGRSRWTSQWEAVLPRLEVHRAARHRVEEGALHQGVADHLPEELSKKLTLLLATVLAHAHEKKNPLLEW